MHCIGRGKAWISCCTYFLGLDRKYYWSLSLLIPGEMTWTNKQKWSHFCFSNCKARIFFSKKKKIFRFFCFERDNFPAAVVVAVPGGGGEVTDRQTDRSSLSIGQYRNPFAISLSVHQLEEQRWILFFKSRMKFLMVSGSN